MYNCNLITKKFIQFLNYFFHLKWESFRIYFKKNSNYINKIFKRYDGKNSRFYYKKTILLTTLGIKLINIAYKFIYDYYYKNLKI